MNHGRRIGTLISLDDEIEAAICAHTGFWSSIRSDDQKTKQGGTNERGLRVRIRSGHPLTVEIFTWCDCSRSYAKPERTFSVIGNKCIYWTCVRSRHKPGCQNKLVGTERRRWIGIDVLRLVNCTISTLFNCHYESTCVARDYPQECVEYNWLALASQTCRVDQYGTGDLSQICYIGTWSVSRPQVSALTTLHIRFPHVLSTPERFRTPPHDQTTLSLELQRVPTRIRWCSGRRGLSRRLQQDFQIAEMTALEDWILY